MNKKDLVLNNLHWLICHKTKPKQILRFPYEKKKSNVNPQPLHLHIPYSVPKLVTIEYKIHLNFAPG